MSALGGGIELGVALDGLERPVAPAVPYLYGTLVPNVGVSLSGAGPNLPDPAGGWGASVADDPTDVGALVKLSTPVGEVGFSGSQDGEIPHLPTNTPDDRPNPQIVGNLYLYAPASFLVRRRRFPPKRCWTSTRTTTAVGPPDASGHPLIGDRRRAAALGGAVDDVKFGLNGELDASLPISKSLSNAPPTWDRVRARGGRG